MNLLGRKIARELLLSSSPSTSRKCLLFLLRQQQHPQLHSPLPILQQHSSLYSTTTTTNTRKTTWSKNQKESYAAKNPKPQQQPLPPPPPPSSSPAEKVQIQTLEWEIETELGPKEKVPAANAEWPRPSEIPWQGKVANSVHLIGRVHIPVQFEASLDGKYWAGTIISQQNSDSSDSPPFWIPIIFEGDLAHVAACHLKEKDWVYIAGQLSADPPPFNADRPPFTTNQGEANVQVMVRSINFVEYSPMKKAATPENLQSDNSLAGCVKDKLSVNQMWKNLLAKPHEWWDIRLKKGNSMEAAFENKDNGELLWINESTPEWILKMVDCLTFDHKMVQKSPKSVSEIKDDGDPASKSWRDLIKNPQRWWDNREHKLNGSLKNNYPDFKHKDSTTALWLNRAPEWVLSGLDGLEFDAQLPKMKQAKESKGEDSWKNLVENPNRWWDNRIKKLNPRAPDFKHKDTGEALWLSDSPSWVASRLPPVEAKHTAATMSKTQSM